MCIIGPSRFRQISRLEGNGKLLLIFAAFGFKKVFLRGGPRAVRSAVVKKLTVVCDQTDNYLVAHGDLEEVELAAVSWTVRQRVFLLRSVVPAHKAGNAGHDIDHAVCGLVGGGIKNYFAAVGMIIDASALRRGYKEDVGIDFK